MHEIYIAFAYKQEYNRIKLKSEEGIYYEQKNHVRK